MGGWVAEGGGAVQSSRLGIARDSHPLVCILHRGAQTEWQAVWPIRSKAKKGESESSTSLDAAIAGQRRALCSLAETITGSGNRDSPEGIVESLVAYEVDECDEGAGEEEATNEVHLLQVLDLADREHQALRAARKKVMATDSRHGERKFLHKKNG